MHKPVLLNEVLEYLNPQPGGVFIDATINGGGHAEAIAKQIGKTGKLLGIDRDCTLLQSEPLSYKLQVTSYKLVCDTFANIQHIAEEQGFTKVNGILFDLGFSSFHIEESGRGFSFLRDEPLDMRYNTESGASARDIVATWPEEKLNNIFFTLGGERYARRIARRLVEERERAPVSTTAQLVEIIRKAVPRAYWHGRIHFATRTFQALRMCVNEELEHVAKGIAGAISLLASGGRIAIISFHSGEDRIVKELFRQYEREGIMRRVTKKPLRSSRVENAENPRARSAKLRVAERVQKKL
ncbi:MAG: 16S rRNA (cytosine1402-N4)-methyltransferase [Parcubacteria group bacterium Gr01-1014_70]|nr:MAG: 16S rRNA (cytosine1402-N4)-methyltransferase [Parcubacteria group bacterium Gr01-1014_70]